MFELLQDEIERQDRLHPAGYPNTRDGIRLGIAALEDELHEVWTEWELIKRRIGNPDHSLTEDITGELYQVAAVAMRIIRSLNGT